MAENTRKCFQSAWNLDPPTSVSAQPSPLRRLLFSFFKLPSSFSLSQKFFLAARPGCLHPEGPGDLILPVGWRGLLSWRNRALPFSKKVFDLVTQYVL